MKTIKHMNLCKCVLGTTVLLVGLGSQGRADVIVSNVMDASQGTDTPGYTNGAQEFTMPAAGGTLQDVILTVDNTGGPLNVALYSDNSGLPGSSLLNLGTITPTGSGYSNYTLNGTYLLVGGWTYWLGVTYVGVPSWGNTLGTYSGSGILGPNFAGSTNGGVSWSAGPIDPYGAYMLRVDAAPTPEPATIFLSLLPLAGIGLVRRTTRRHC